MSHGGDGAGSNLVFLSLGVCSRRLFWADLRAFRRLAHAIAKFTIPSRDSPLGSVHSVFLILAGFFATVERLELASSKGSVNSPELHIHSTAPKMSDPATRACSPLRGSITGDSAAPDEKAFRRRLLYHRR